MAKITKKIKLLVITHSYPTKYNPTGGLFLKNQYDYIKKHCDIKIIFPFPYVPKISLFNRFYKYSQLTLKENFDGIEIYHPKYFFFPRFNFLKYLENVFLCFESIFSYLSSKKVISDLKEKWNFDMIKIHGCVRESLIGINLKKKYNMPLIVMLHGEDITKFSKMPLLHKMALTLLKNSDAVICKSLSLKKEVLDIGISEKKIYVIPTGYMVKRFKPMSKLVCRKILNLDKNKKIILFAGDLVERKGVIYLIMAMKILQNDNLLCYILGNGILKEKLIDLSIKLGLGKNVFFVGEKNPDEMPLWINSSDLLVLPSLNEGMPSVLSEALACGKPVVATKISGNPEIVTKDVGFLVKPKNENDLAEKITLALKKKWNKKKLINKAKEFSITTSIKKTLDLYLRLIK